MTTKLRWALGSSLVALAFGLGLAMGHSEGRPPRSTWVGRPNEDRPALTAVDATTEGEALALGATEAAAATSAERTDAVTTPQTTEAEATSQASPGDYVLTGEEEVREPTAEQSIDQDALLGLLPLASRDPATSARARAWLGPGKGHGNQGNPAISEHTISRATCLSGLRGQVLQTAQQRRICGGELEVPIHHGDPEAATTCIDVFEYPNRPCVLPLVLVHPIAAAELCALAGKRLCLQSEWERACEGGADGEPPRKYAYGDALDLDVCITGKTKSPSCDVDYALWSTCGTHTEPSGSAPRCRSRLGVYDQHGNVAEIMVRPEKGVSWVQLKGSAFFYDGVIYPDHCRYDPRWHVAPVDQSWHVNYHLGFRCCRSLEPKHATPVGRQPPPAPETAGADGAATR